MALAVLAGSIAACCLALSASARRDKSADVVVMMGVPDSTHQATICSHPGVMFIPDTHVVLCGVVWCAGWPCEAS